MRGARLALLGGSLLPILLAATLPTPTLAQRPGTVHRIPFRFERNRVILPVRVQGSRELSIILDSGMAYDGLLLYKPELRDSIGVAEFAEAQLGGAGAGGAARALLAQSASFSVGDLTVAGQPVIVLQGNSFAGFPSDGVMGYSLLGHYALEIDYDAREIWLYEGPEIPAKDGWQVIPLSFKQNHIPWVDIRVDLDGTGDIPMSAYIDLAAGDALVLLTRAGMKFSVPAGLPSCHLGRGLSGDVNGQCGRARFLRLGSFALPNVAAAFTPAQVRSRQPGADAVLGNGIFRRFNAVFDYGSQRLYLKPNRFYADSTAARSSS